MLTGYAISSAFQFLLEAPLERVKLLLQCQNASEEIPPRGRYKGVINTSKRVYKEQGLLAFWRGFSPLVLRVVPQVILSKPLLVLSSAVFPQVDPRKSFARAFINYIGAGTLSYGLGLLVVQPLDVMHVLMSMEVVPERSTRYGNVVECFRLVSAQKGLAALWNGFAPALLANTLYRALYILAVSFAKPRLLGPRSEDSSVLREVLFFHAAALTATALVYPLETIAHRMSAQAGRAQPQYRNSLEAAKHIWREEGIRGFYAGGLIGIGRTVLLSLIFAAYQQFDAARVERNIARQRGLGVGGRQGGGARPRMSRRPPPSPAAAAS
jgi:hypothetical protein